MQVETEVKLNPRYKYCQKIFMIFFSVLLSGTVAWGQANDPTPNARIADGDPFLSRCLKVIDIPISSRESLPNLTDIGKVRRMAIYNAGAQAVKEVVGMEIASSREIITALHNDIGDRQFREEIREEFGGLVRPRIEREQLVKIDGANFMELNFIVTVCIPKKPEVPPQQIVGVPASFFDPLNGEPKVWYWRSNEGKFEFFDNQGFHPRTGDILKPITREVVGTLLARRAEEARRAEVEEARAQAETRDTRRCDDLAANPSDMQRPGNIPGVEYAILRLNAAEAIRVCRSALKRAPTDGRYAYQLARALQAKGNNISEAARLLDLAIKRNHVAAYDNLGWVLRRQRKLADARTMFQRGATAGDPSSMVSLARLIEDEAREGNYEIQIERALNLYRKAARLGHADAKQRLLELPREIELRRIEAENQRLRQDQVLEIMGGVFGAILNNASRN